MKPSTELFDLVKSLTKSEKRFFKLSSSLQSGEKNYLKIFDAIDKMDTYDEQSLKDQFKGETFVRHLPSEKNHLYKLILKSLRSYYSDHSISSLLRQEIKNVEILYKKALYKECNKFVSRAKQMAIEHEKFYYVFELISWEKMLLEEAYESGKFDKNLDELIKEEAGVIEKLRNLAEYQVLYSKINYVFRRGGFARNADEKETVQDIANYHLIKGKNTALSVRASSICYYIKGLCAATSRDYKDSYVNFLKVKQILDDNPAIRNDLPRRYILTYQHLMYCYIDGAAYDAVFELIARLRDMEKEQGFNTIASQVSIFTTTYQAELITYIRTGRFDEAVALIDDILDKMHGYGEKVNKEQEVLFSYFIAYAYFGNGNYNKALFWINKVLNDNEQNLRQDIYSFSRLLNLVIHFELGNYDLLEYIIKSTFRYLNKKERDYTVENTILSHMKKLARAGSEEERNQVFQGMQLDLKQLFEKEEERVVLDYFNFNAWIRSHLEGVSMTNTM